MKSLISSLRQIYCGTWT